MEDFLIHKLNERKEKGLLRTLSSFEGLEDFYSNDYLGFSKLKFESTMPHIHNNEVAGLIKTNYELADLYNITSLLQNRGTLEFHTLDPRSKLTSCNELND